MWPTHRSKRKTNNKYETLMQPVSNDWLKFIQETKPNLNNKSKTNIKEQLSDPILKKRKYPPIKINATKQRSERSALSYWPSPPIPLNRIPIVQELKRDLLKNGNKQQIKTQHKDSKGRDEIETRNLFDSLDRMEIGESPFALSIRKTKLKKAKYKILYHRLTTHLEPST